MVKRDAPWAYPATTYPSPGTVRMEVAWLMPVLAPYDLCHRISPSGDKLTTQKLLSRSVPVPDVVHFGRTGQDQAAFHAVVRPRRSSRPAGCQRFVCQIGSPSEFSRSAHSILLPGAEGDGVSGQEEPRRPATVRPLRSGL